MIPHAREEPGCLPVKRRVVLTRLIPRRPSVRPNRKAAGSRCPDKPADLQATAQPTSRGVASYREFAGALIEFGLIDAPALERYAADSAEGVLGLSRALVKAGYLTPYQAAAVYQNKSRGLLIGNYLILDKLGQGGMGVVFKARHRKLGRLGALKILPPSFTRDHGAVTRFKREFEAAARLKHINLVAAFEADEDRGVHFLVMDYVAGRQSRPRRQPARTFAGLPGRRLLDPVGPGT